MQIKLLDYTNLTICSHAIRTCWNSFNKSDNGDEKDKALIERVGNKYKHKSTLEHLNYSFYIQGISRACLHEVVRHRIASYSVKSTRYTLKELKNEKTINRDDYDTIKKYIVLTNNPITDNASISALINLQSLARLNISNDIVKYALPESYKTELTMSINARSLQNFLKLRTSKSALWEIRELGYNFYETLPKEHQYLFNDYVL